MRIQLFGSDKSYITLCRLILMAVLGLILFLTVLHFTHWFCVVCDRGSPNPIASQHHCPLQAAILPVRRYGEIFFVQSMCSYQSTIFLLLLLWMF
jgi:hypothetical protein